MTTREVVAAGVLADGTVCQQVPGGLEDRMGDGDRRFVRSTARAMRRRAIYLSGDWNEYWEWHITEDQQGLYRIPPWRIDAK